LRSAATRRGVHVVVYEGGEAGRFDPPAIDAGVDCVLRALHDLGMIDAAPPATEPVVECGKTEWVRARRSGLVQLWVQLGARVTRRQPLGIIADTAGELAATVTAPSDGIVVGLATDPRVYQGDAIVHIGHVGKRAS
jgi:predicted deacylase